MGGELVEASTLVPYTRVESPAVQITSDLRVPQTDMVRAKELQGDDDIRAYHPP